MKESKGNAALSRGVEPRQITQFSLLLVLPTVSTVYLPIPFKIVIITENPHMGWATTADRPLLANKIWWKVKLLRKKLKLTKKKLGCWNTWSLENVKHGKILWYSNSFHYENPFRTVTSLLEDYRKIFWTAPFFTVLSQIIVKKSIVVWMCISTQLSGRVQKSRWKSQQLFL